MLRKFLAVVLLVGLGALSGCAIATKPAAFVASSLTSGNSAQTDAWRQYWSYYDNMQAAQDDFDKLFLNYDRNDPFPD